jgi:hypothetical protein
MEMSIHNDPVSSVFFRNAFTEACFQPANVKNDAGTIIDSEALGGMLELRFGRSIAASVPPSDWLKSFCCPKPAADSWNLCPVVESFNGDNGLVTMVSFDLDARVRSPGESIMNSPKARAAWSANSSMLWFMSWSVPMPGAAKRLFPQRFLPGLRNDFEVMVGK